MRAEDEFFGVGGDKDYSPELPETMLDSYEEPAVFINFLNTQAFGDGTVRMTFGEHMTQQDIAIRGAYRLTFQKAAELAEALTMMVKAGMQAQTAETEARRKMI